MTRPKRAGGCSDFSPQPSPELLFLLRVTAEGRWCFSARPEEAHKVSFHLSLPLPACGPSPERNQPGALRRSQRCRCHPGQRGPRLCRASSPCRCLCRVSACSACPFTEPRVNCSPFLSPLQWQLCSSFPGLSSGAITLPPGSP